MKKILVIQSRKSTQRQEAERKAYERAVGGIAEFSFISTLDLEQRWDSPAEIVRGYDGVIIGGSSDFFWHYETDEFEEEYKGVRMVLERLRQVIEYLVERQVPTLGICFGHQLIAEVFGGAVSHDESQKKVGTHDVVVTETGKDDRLFGDLGPVFPAQYVHKNSITRPPLGSVVIGNGPACHFSALRYGKNCYTCQFHPELQVQDFAADPAAFSQYVPAGKKVEDMVRETPGSNGLIRAFVERIATS